jgi:subtilisin-like proprotein convertase family protein
MNRKSDISAQRFGSIQRRVLPRYATSLCCAFIFAHPALAADQCASNSVIIPDNTPSGIVIPFEFDSSNEQVDSLRVDLDITHPWVGDLVVTLQSPTGTIVTLIDRPGIPSVGFPGPFGCGGRDINASFTDSATLIAEDVCSINSTPVMTGDLMPSMPLSAFEGEPVEGVWLLTISDRSEYDTGMLNQACVNISTSISCTPDLNGDGDLNFFDVSAFLSAYNDQDPSADFNADGLYNFFDVSQFLAAYADGCP